ncbi:MAG: hypothetical protein J2O48_10175 [Solirubrobacterales bacterium]|nr:hypothetical protein [Solirubrobacterales bacterium]
MGDDATPIELTAPEFSFGQLVWSDYLASMVEREESAERLALLFLPRMLLNPSLQLALTIRICQCGPRALWNLMRWIQIVFFSSEFHRFAPEDNTELGPGLSFPHPANIFISGGVKIGSGVTIYNNVTIGSNRHVPRDVATPVTVRIGDRAVVYGYCSLQGPYDIGNDAVVGMHVLLDSDVPPGALRTYKGLRRAEEWKGEGRNHYRPGVEPRVLGHR